MKHLKELMKQPGFVFGVVVFFGSLLVALFGPLFIDEASALEIGKYSPVLPPSGEHILGTNTWGQDSFARVIYGLRSSLYVGLLAAVVATVFGTLVGVIAGYKGGIVDELLTAATNLFVIIPAFIVIILVSSILEKRSLTLVAIIIGCISWSWVARAVRAQAASLRSSDHVSLAKLNGYGLISILVRQILPYIGSYIFMTFAIQIATGILNEAAISMIGLGPYDTVTLGNILNDAQHNEAVLNGIWWNFIPATIIITMLQFSMFSMNTSLEKVFNPKLQEG
ncbi:MAG: ABC transporter permease [Fibrobacterota bacterium]